MEAVARETMGVFEPELGTSEGPGREAGAARAPWAPATRVGARLGVLAAVLLAGSVRAGAATHVVAVGNDRGRSDEPSLRYAERDATQLATVLRRLGRVRGEDAVLLTGESAAGLRRVLLGVNTRLRAAAGEHGSDDALIVYYSGHADASGLHLGDTALPFDELRSLVESSPARVRVLIVDACRSGGVTQGKGARPVPAFPVDLTSSGTTKGFAIIASSAPSEDSQESQVLEASFFTHHLVTALRGAADRDHDGRVTLGEAYAYTYRETLRSTGRTHELQHPTYRFDLEGQGDFAMTHLGDGRAQLGSLALGEPGTYLLFEDREGGSLVAEVAVEPGGAELLLPPGRYFVQRRGARSYREYRLGLEAGARAGLESLDYEDVAYARLLRKGGGEAVSWQRLGVFGTARGPLVPGAGVTPGLAIGWGIDLAWLSFGLQGRWGRSAFTSVDGALAVTGSELALRGVAERYLDTDWGSLSLGLVLEGARHAQSFTTDGVAPERVAWAFGFGGLVAWEHGLWDRLLVRVEGGPLTHVLPRARPAAGATTTVTTETPLTWWSAVGLGWRY